MVKGLLERLHIVKKKDDQILIPLPNMCLGCNGSLWFQDLDGKFVPTHKSEITKKVVLLAEMRGAEANLQPVLAGLPLAIQNSNYKPAISQMEILKFKIERELKALDEVMEQLTREIELMCRGSR